MKKFCFCLFFVILISGCTSNYKAGGYCITKPNDTTCYQLEDFTCNELCELRGFYNESYVDFVPMIQSPNHKEKYLIPDYNQKRFCNGIKEKAVGCARDCQEQVKLMSTDDKPLLGNCCCN